MTSTQTAPPVGSVVWRRVDPLAAHKPLGGHVVDHYVDEEGCPGVKVVAFRKSAGRLWVDVHRIPLAELSDAVTPPDRHTCARGYRQLFAVLGQTQTVSGPPLTEYERRLYDWAHALRRAGEPVQRDAGPEIAGAEQTAVPSAGPDNVAGVPVVDPAAVPGPLDWRERAKAQGIGVAHLLKQARLFAANRDLPQPSSLDEITDEQVQADMCDWLGE